MVYIKRAIVVRCWVSGFKFSPSSYSHNSTNSSLIFSFSIIISSVSKCFKMGSTRAAVFFANSELVVVLLSLSVMIGSVKD